MLLGALRGVGGEGMIIGVEGVRAALRLEMGLLAGLILLAILGLFLVALLGLLLTFVILFGLLLTFLVLAGLFLIELLGVLCLAALFGLLVGVLRALGVEILR